MSEFKYIVQWFDDEWIDVLKTNDRKKGAAFMSDVRDRPFRLLARTSKTKQTVKTEHVYEHRTEFLIEEEEEV